MSITISIELPTDVKVALGDTGRETLIPVSAIAKAHPQVIRFAVLNGLIGAVNNVSRGKDENGKENSDDVWASMRDKRVAVWMTGDWAGKGGGGERASAALKEAFIAERLAAGATMRQIEAAIKAAVKDAFGEKEPATFSRFMDALALTLSARDNGGKPAKAEDVAAMRDRIEAKYKGLAEEAAKQRANVKAGLDLSAIDI
jgi:hypothetical protein